MKVFKFNRKVILVFTSLWFSLIMTTYKSTCRLTPMKMIRRTALILLIGLLLIALIYVFIWEDTGEVQMISSSRHHIIANNAYLKHSFYTKLNIMPHPVVLTTEIPRVPTHYKVSDVKAGERLPQGVANDVQDGAEEVPEAKMESDEEKAMTRASEYCAPPEISMKGEEGTVSEGFVLQHVHIVIRHGDRSPLYVLPGYELPWISCDINITMAKIDPVVTSYLTTMKTIWSQLDRNSPAYRFGLFPHSRYCEGAQLTGNGALQHIRNGQYLSDVYVDKWKLFDADFISQHLKVFSTEYGRTYQSAIAFLFGFLPVFDLKNIPISFSGALTFCSRRLSGLPCECIMAHKLDVIHKKEYHKRTKNHTLHNEIKSTVAEVLHVPKSKLPWLSALSDGFNGHTCHNLKLPCSRTDPNSCITWKTIGQLWEFLDFNGASQLSSYAYQRQQRLLMHPFLHIILSRMLNVTKSVETSKVVLYSGHDKTITPLLTALGIHDGHWPRYASRLIFELYSETGKKKQTNYYIRVLFNGEDRTKQVRFCKGKTIDGLCPLSYFQHFVFHEDLQYFGKKTYEEACKVSQ